MADQIISQAEDSQVLKCFHLRPYILCCHRTQFNENILYYIDMMGLTRKSDLFQLPNQQCNTFLRNLQHDCNAMACLPHRPLFQSFCNLE